MIGKEGMAEYLTADKYSAIPSFPIIFQFQPKATHEYYENQTFSQQFKHAKLHSDLLQA